MPLDVHLSKTIIIDTLVYMDQNIIIIISTHFYYSNLIAKILIKYKLKTSCLDK